MDLTPIPPKSDAQYSDLLKRIRSIRSALSCYALERGGPSKAKAQLEHDLQAAIAQAIARKTAIFHHNCKVLRHQRRISGPPPPPVRAEARICARIEAKKRADKIEAEVNAPE
ncbi:hypothetical protein EXIGLDRAFT_781423 [Exidia glandulosa HHB12029]|uniref:Uncharacterized protein n=1 Tax=Exidia glandulosa HHB12029 TaxID=1314781 RepID=A0A165B917_EXIGL|nr:hypothetical protein EXIGLDRAFT_781423 [Exidia glandulosa HHB12029]